MSSIDQQFAGLNIQGPPSVQQTYTGKQIPKYTPEQYQQQLKYLQYHFSQQHPQYNNNNNNNTQNDTTSAPSSQPIKSSQPIQSSQPAQPQQQQVKKPAAQPNNKQPAQQQSTQQIPAQPFMLSPDANAKLQKTFEQICNKYSTPAIAGMISTPTGNACVYTGVTKVGGHHHIQPTDLFHLGSCTKAMTGTLVAIFVQKGMLSWDATMASLFPELADKMTPAYRDVTVKMLTAHKSGITGNCGNFANGSLWKALWSPSLNPMDGRRMVVVEVLTRPPAHKPGTKVEYSNYNYMIVGAILEKITRYPWETLIKAELFDPLGMTSAGFGAQGVYANQPWPHVIENGSVKAITPDFKGDNPPTLGPAGTVHCSLLDWVKFIRFNMDGFLGKPTPLLPSAAFKILHDQFEGEKHTSGGWMRTYREWGGPVLTHAGSNTMNYALVWAAPKKEMCFVVACNLGGDGASKACDEAIAAMLTATGLSA